MTDKDLIKKLRDAIELARVHVAWDKDLTSPSSDKSEVLRLCGQALDAADEYLGSQKENPLLPWYGKNG